MSLDSVVQDPAVDESVSIGLLMKLLKHAPDLLCVAGPDGRFVWVSDAWPKALGWSKEELMAEPFISFVHPSDVERTVQQAGAMYEEGADAVNFENRYRTRTGDYVWLQWNAVAEREGGLLLCSARDVTEQKNTELRAAERTEMLEMSENLVGVGHWRVDVEKNEIHWSTTVYEIYGLDPEDGPPSLEDAINAYHEDDRQMVDTAVAAAIEAQEPFSFTARVVRPTGEVRWVESDGVAETAQDGRVVAIFGVFRDITDERHAQETLRRTERMASIGTMAAGVAHEINNPLSYLTGNLQLIAEELAELEGKIATDDLEVLREMLADAQAGGHRVRRIVNGLRSFSRVTHAQADYVDVAKAIEAAVAIAEHEIRLKAELVLDVSDVPRVFIDETHFVQVLINLLVNAAQALPEGKAMENTITLATRHSNGEVIVSVADTGPGVPPEVRDRIFDPFFTTKDVGKGTGLGLSISHSIISQQAGRIELDSGEDGGATFRVILPESEGTPFRVEGAPPEQEEPRAAPDQLPSLLIVDDETGVAKMLARALKGQFTVTTVPSGSAAIELFEAGDRFDLVICDLMMPEVTGRDVMHHMKSIDPGLLAHLLFATGGTVGAEVAADAEAHGVEILEKPFDLPQLRLRLDHFLTSASERE